MAVGRYSGLVAALLATAQLAKAQEPGSSTPEVHPKLPTWKCTTSGGCVQQDTSVVLDWNYRWIHTVNGSTSCTTSSGVDSSLCPDEPTCAQNCVVEGATYASSGVTTSGDSMTMNQYVTSSGKTSNASPRVYLLGPDGNYVLMKLLGQELSFDVDLSTLPCGENGALYLSEMDASGGRNPYNTGGANYGSGYCDAQCPVQTWMNGTLNTSGKGYCCNEMDILEANAYANAFTPHPCANGDCDKSGCGFNPYAKGFQSFYGPGLTLDTSKPFTVVTQFPTSDGTTTGTLTEIVRYYVQNGKKLSTSSSGDIITASGCTSASSYGGLANMGQALGRGMVLAFSIWNDNSQYMNWLDSGSNGPCSSTEGNPSTIQSQHPDTHVVFSNIRWGDIGSTLSTTPGGGGSSSSSSIVTSTKTTSTTSSRTTTTSTTTSKTTLTTSKTTTTSASGATQTHWGQCGGNGWTGPTACASPYTCQTQNPWYSQCL